jgi:deoxyribodipyrimidine photo-lyase
MSKIAVHWFRRDLRIQDNPSLHYASENGSVMPIYILDTVNNTQNEYKLGEASAWWLHHSLYSLNESLNQNLNFFSGDPEEIILNLIKEYDIESFSWNRCYSPWEVKRDTRIKSLLKTTSN